MQRDELKKVVEEVVSYLAEKGYLAGLPAAPSPAVTPEKTSTPPFMAPRVTLGASGKLFHNDLGRTFHLGGFSERTAKRSEPPLWSARPNPPLEAGSSDPSIPLKAGAQGATEDHTRSPDCPHCGPLSKLSESQLTQIGADRLTVCHPTQSCSPIARAIDHTLLKPNATQEEIAKLCEEARRYCFASVCVNPSYAALCVRLLKGSGVKVCTVVGFPLGSTTATVKAIEARDAIANGADEIDMVMNIGALKSGNDALVLEDARAVREATRGKVLKVILETGLLSREEKIRACRISKQAGADFVKTSTGFGAGGATVEDIRLMRETVGPGMGVKASGGVRDMETAAAMLAAGATRIGASASISIVTGGKSGNGKY